MPVWQSAAPPHLKLLDRAFNSIRFILPNLSISLEKRKLVAGFSLLYKIYNNTRHAMNGSLPAPFVPGRFTRHTQAFNDYSFQHIRFNTNQFSRCFVPYYCKLWNNLPNDVVSCTDLDKFKIAVKGHVSM